MQTITQWLRTPITLRGWLLTVLLSSIVIWLAPASAAQTPAAYLPIIANNAGQPAPTTLTTLIDTDAGFVTVALVPNTTRVILAYTDRRDGNKLKLVEHTVGATIIPIADPFLARMLLGDVSRAQPSFEFPGPKQGFGMPLIVAGRLRVYATSRDEGDPSGWFKVKYIDMAIP